MHLHKGRTVSIFYEGNYSGSVIIYVDPSKVENTPNGKKSVEIEFFELKSLVIKYLRDKMVQAVENMEEQEFEEWLTYSLINPSDDIYHHKFDPPVGS